MSKLTLTQLFFANAFIMLAFMTITTFICPDGLSGGECVKHADNKIFVVQLAANLLVAVYVLIADKSKWGILLINLVFTVILYCIAATLHSISKAGLF